MIVPEVLSAPIRPRSAVAEAAARQRLDALVKPLGALGRLEDVAAWLAGAQDRCPPAPIDRIRVVIFAGDHGVADEGVSAYPREVTGAMVAAFLGGFAGVTVLARGAGAQVRVLDLGVRVDLPDLPAEVTRFKVRRGSGDISRQDALTPAELVAGLEAGAAIADEEILAGADLLIPGDMGIGNTTVAAAMVAAALGVTAEEVVGTGTGVSGVALLHKRAIIDLALSRSRPEGPLGILLALGSADAAATVGFLIRAAARSTPVLLDGVYSAACALIASQLAPDAVDWWLAGHRSTEPSQRLALRELGLHPLLDLGMRLGEGSGAMVAVPVVRSAQALLAQMGTLQDLGLGVPDETHDGETRDGDTSAEGTVEGAVAAGGSA
jgi:nicotinate-nucleotide--dimethylbenzimidazole phosphoribosyltransferase